MEHDTKVRAEQVSALADGQLRGEEFAQTLQWMAESQEARASWYAYQLVGDVLRSPELVNAAQRDADFTERLRIRLQDEGTLSPPGRNTDMPGVAQPTLSGRGGQSANEARYGWKLVAGLTSLVAMTAMGWQLLAGSYFVAEPVQWAQASGPAAVTGPVGQEQMIRDPRLDQLLTAHQQFGGTSALQMPAGFLRNATFERAAR
jgi:sigma-E factor negative regulatory protein RseA